MMTIKVAPYLMLNGNAKEAIQFYEHALDAQILTINTYGEVPDLPSGNQKDLVAHAELRIGDSKIMLCDRLHGSNNSPVERGNLVTICISTNDTEKSKRFFEALKHEGKVMMPFQETSFSTAFGSLTDKFGITFLIETEKQR